MRKMTKQRLDTSLKAWREASETAIQEYEAHRRTTESESDLIASLVASAHATDAQQQYDDLVLEHQKRLLNAIANSQRLASEYFHDKRVFDREIGRP